MPQYFHFRSPDTQSPSVKSLLLHSFDDELKTERCPHILYNGLRCKRNVTMGLPFCFQHRGNLKVDTSTIPNAGKGLFANNGSKDDAVVFEKNDIITPYYGELVAPAVILDRYGDYTAPYGLEITQDRYTDGALRRGLGSLINHKPDKYANVRFSIKRNKQEVNLVATKTIRNKKELFVNYGRRYKFNEPGVYYSTNHAKYKL